MGVSDAGAQAENQAAEPGNGSTALGIFLLVVLAVALAFVVKALYPVDLPVKTSPSFIDTIFDNRLVVWAARLLLVSAAAVLAFGGIFIAVSIGIRMKNGHWLRRAGPFEISEKAVEEIEGQFEFWRDAALEGQTEIAQLKEQLQESDELIERLHQALDDG